MIDGMKIKRERERRGLSQRALADAVGMSQPAIKKIESGETLRSRYQVDLERYLGLTGINNRREIAADNQLPVYGTVEGGNGMITKSIEPVDFVPRPSPLADVTSAYALYVRGTAMFPRYREGEMLIVHPHIPARPEDGVVVYDEEGKDAHICEFVRSTPKEWVLRRYSPKVEEFNLPKDAWPTCEVVYGLYSHR